MLFVLILRYVVVYCGSSFWSFSYAMRYFLTLLSFFWQRFPSQTLEAMYPFSFCGAAPVAHCIFLGWQDSHTKHRFIVTAKDPRVHSSQCTESSEAPWSGSLHPSFSNTQTANFPVAWDSGQFGHFVPPFLSSPLLPLLFSSFPFLVPLLVRFVSRLRSCSLCFPSYWSNIATHAWMSFSFNSLSPSGLKTCYMRSIWSTPSTCCQFTSKHPWSANVPLLFASCRTDQPYHQQRVADSCWLLYSQSTELITISWNFGISNQFHGPKNWWSTDCQALRNHLLGR